MKQTRLYAATDRATAKALMQPLDLAFAEEGYPVSIHENPELDGEWTVSVYVPSATVEGTETLLQQIAGEYGIEVEIQHEDLPEIDWVAETLRKLAPVRAGRFVLHGSHDRGMAKPGEIAVEIDAGLAFGTGHHGTTAGCLDMYSAVAKARRFHNALDLGTGSGVLAIAVAKHARIPVLATDIDPVAELTARDNTRLNNIHPLVKCITATGLNHRQITARAPFDLVIANILAKPLQGMARDIGNATASGGVVILSGLLPHQRAPLVARFRQHGMAFIRAHIRDGWLTLVLQKRT